MWPWEHLAFGYLLYTGYTRLRHGEPPGYYPALALAVATQFPDVVDKPLAWTVHVLPTARSLAHSAFTAVGLVTLVAVVARRKGVPAVGTAVAIGYLSHLLGDVLYTVFRGGPLGVWFLLWPLVRQPVRTSPGLVESTTRLLTEFATYLGSPAGQTYLALEVLFLLTVTTIWAVDGLPGLRAPE